MNARALGKVSLLAACALAPACGGPKQALPVTETTQVQPRQDPTVVKGCLGTGVAGEFVLTAANTESGRPATYHLNAPATVKLADYVGQQVNVSGVLRAEETVATTGRAVEEKPAKGAEGTPTVRTATELDMRTLDVSNVEASGAKCEAGETGNKSK